MGPCPDAIKRLIDRFDQQSDHIRSPDYNETLIRIDFINPLMGEPGWDIDNRQGFAERYREVVHEDRVKVAGQTKAPDYSFRIGGRRKFFLEAKKPAVNIKVNWEPAYQLRRYAWSAKLLVSLLTDFEDFAVYDARIQPKQLEKASVARREFVHYTQYAERWDFLSGTFSKDAVLRGEFDRYCEAKKGRGAQPFDEAFLGEIEQWRKAIAGSLARHNAALDEAALNFAVQRIIDRIIVLRIAEDRGTETVGQLQALLNGERVYERLNAVFRGADERYNSGLFHFDREPGRDEPPDTLTPGLEVDDRRAQAQPPRPHPRRGPRRAGRRGHQAQPATEMPGGRDQPDARLRATPLPRTRPARPRPEHPVRQQLGRDGHHRHGRVERDGRGGAPEGQPVRLRARVPARVQCKGR